MTWASSNTFAARRWQSFSWYPGPKRLSNSSSAVTEINENVAEATTLVSTEACKLLSICCTIVEAGTGLELHKLLVRRINTLKVYLDWRAAWKIWQGSNLEEPSLPLSTLHSTAKTSSWDSTLLMLGCSLRSHLFCTQRFLSGHFLVLVFLWILSLRNSTEDVDEAPCIWKWWNKRVYAQHDGACDKRGSWKATVRASPTVMDK